MTGIDWTVLVVYIGAMVAMSVWLSRGQESADDYYVGGRNLPWWAVGISTMATQTSANSFIGIPAFVALKEGGGLTWLQYELAVPLAMVTVMVFLIPLFRKLELVSVYEYLELRFDRSTRLTMSGIFLVARGLGTGIGVYASAVVLQVCLGLEVWVCILLIGVITVFYDTLGGMAAVVYSDVVQMLVLMVGLFLCIGLALDSAGGVSAAIAVHAPERLHGVQMSHGLGDGGSTPFWAFLIGGFFLYVSYYGVDQSQAQRELSAPTTADTKRSLIFNGLARFPLTVLYLLMGLAVGAAYHASPELQAAVPDGKLDYLVPMFVLQKLPPGARGLIFAALLAAAMSSLDSALNSLSAATMRDFIEPRLQERGLGDDASMLRWGKITTVAWGTAMTVFAFFVGDISKTVVEGINKVGSMFYGPILAGFLAGILFRQTRGLAVRVGLLVGVLVNATLWQFVPSVYWMWWNVIGLVVTLVVAVGMSQGMTAPDPAKLEGTTLSLRGLLQRERGWLGAYAGLAGYFIVLLLVAGLSHALLARLM